MNNITSARMLLATAALAVVAALFTGGANAMLIDVDGGTDNGAAATPSPQQPAVPYLSHGTGVDASLWGGETQTQLTGVHAALQRDRTTTASTAQTGTIPYLSQGVGVDESSFAGRPSLGLTGDSALTRVSAPEPPGLSGDSAPTRYPGQIQQPVATGNADLDWTSFGAGAGMAALIAVAIGGVWLTTRRRGGVALP